MVLVLVRHDETDDELCRSIRQNKPSGGEGGDPKGDSAATAGPGVGGKKRGKGKGKAKGKEQLVGTTRM